MPVPIWEDPGPVPAGSGTDRALLLLFLRPYLLLLIALFMHYTLYSRPFVLFSTRSFLSLSILNINKNVCISLTFLLSSMCFCSDPPPPLFCCLSRESACTTMDPRCFMGVLVGEACSKFCRGGAWLAGILSLTPGLMVQQANQPR